MAKSQKNQIYVMKLRSSYLSRHNWNLKLSLNEVRKDTRTIVSLGNSQVLRWIVKMQDRQDDDIKASEIKKKIRNIKKRKNSEENKVEITKLYSELYKTQFQQDYMMLVMDSKKDYDRALQGFSIIVDGISVKYKRLLGTAGSIKKSTIIFVNENIYDLLMIKINNGRNLKKEFVAAKLNAYMALTCSASIKVSWPRIIVVNDCITHFNSEVINVDDTNQNIIEPLVTHNIIKEIENNASDGCGVVMPDMSRIWSVELNEGDEPISGVNTRCSFMKGMLFTFDFQQFAKEIANKYEIIDAWGNVQDVRNADAIVTTSMLKLWDSYDSYEDYFKNCMENDYDFSVAKSSPCELENQRQLNYQFTQGYDLTDNQIDRLIAPTVNNIKDILGLDWRKVLLYLCGENLKEENIEYIDPMYKAIMAAPELIRDPYINSRIVRMINKRIRLAKISVLDVKGNFAIVGGDLYALMQSSFGITPITGLLKKGECYHKYWTDNNVDEIVAFRAPQTSHNNVSKLKVVHSDEIDKWFKYIKTCCIINAWDTTPMRMNGMDYDSDTIMSTNNDVLIEAYRQLPAIDCTQKKANKIIPTVDDFVKSEKLGFGDTIGSVTNKATSMITLLSSFQKYTEEYKILSDRVISMQNYQQNSIDRIKGIISRPVPNTWVSIKANKIEKEDNDDIKAKKKLYASIAADKKSYFFIYNYSTLKTEYDNYNKRVNENCKIKFNKSLDELKGCKHKTLEEDEFLRYYYKLLPVDTSPGTINRICWKIEEELNDLSEFKDNNFDYSILKNCYSYQKSDYYKISELYKEYNISVQHLIKENEISESSDRSNEDAMLEIKEQFNKRCHEICPNDEILSNIIVDICYTSNKNKTFAWDVCGNQIYKNILKNKNSSISFPIQDKNGDIFFNGSRFKLQTVIIDGGDVD